uniref:Variant surface glycoprotein n=1 Tax=Trypanosoma brucei TaxID=5691 RepID=A0A1V0FZ34_9TRYP|nr:variant surface glycoprotein [Trypanosoma brucei]
MTYLIQAIKKSKPRVFLALTLAFFASNKPARSAGENSREFRTLCSLYKLLTQAVTPPNVEADSVNTEQTAKQRINQIIADIVKLNLTVAESALLDNVKTKPQPKKLADLKSDEATKGYFEKITDDIFAKMQVSAGNLQDPGEEGQKFRRQFELPLSEQRKQKLRPIFNNLMQKALIINKQQEHLDSAAQLARTEAKRAMIAALYGTKFAEAKKSGISPATEDLMPEPKDFPFSQSKGRDAACATATITEGEASDSLATDIVCLCTSKDGTANSLCTSTPVSGYNDINVADASGGKASGNYKGLIAACKALGTDQGSHLSNAALEAATTEFFSRLGAGGIHAGSRPNALTEMEPAIRYVFGSVVLETTGNPACTSASHAGFLTGEKGVCVDYKNVLTAAKGIKWVAKIKEASRQLQLSDKIFGQSLGLIIAANSIKVQMESALMLGILMTESGEQTEAASSSKLPTIEEQNKCAKFNNNETDCKNNGCDYDKTKNECKPKAGIENPEAGAGDQTGKKCSDYGNKQECEKANDGIPAGQPRKCGWIGEDKSGGDKGFKHCDSDSSSIRNWLLQLLIL